MRTLRRPMAFLLLVWFLPACSTYRTTDLPPQEAVAGQKTVRVMLADAERTQITVEDPWVRADTLGGTTSVSDGWAVPLSSVREIKAKQFNVLLTSAVALGSLAVAGIATFIVLCHPDIGGGCG